jgi:hypothetical protein
MSPEPFRKSTDLEPLPFGLDLCLAARRLKEAGLFWHPQAGCFVWDDMGVIEAPSPFPDRIYFILNLRHFLRRFGTEEEMVDKLVWLPTWHQARLTCRAMAIGDTEVWETLCSSREKACGTELLLLYDLILRGLKGQS